MLTKEILLFQYFLDNRHSLYALAFRLHLPPPRLIEEFLRIKSQSDLERFLNFCHEFVSFFTYEERVKLGLLYIDLHHHHGHFNPDELDKTIEKYYSLNPDWKEEGYSLKGFMFYDQLQITKPEHIKKIVDTPSYNWLLLVKYFYNYYGGASIKLKEDAVSYLRELKNNVDEINQRIGV